MSQTILLLIAAAYLIFECVRGWQRGLARCLVRLVALVVAYFVGLYFAIFVTPFLRKIFSYPDFLIMAVAGLTVGIVVYFVIWLASVVLLKKTSHQKSGAIRFLYGAGGGLIGLFYGFLILWGFISLFRMFGAYAESHTNLPETSRIQVRTPALERQLVGLKETLEGGSTGKVVEKLDILPTSAYQLITKAGQVSADPEAADRFMKYPPVQRLMQTPRLAAILNDPEVGRAAADKNYLVLMRNKNVIAAVNDPDFRKTISDFDFIAALDYALKNPAPAKHPSPSHSP